MHLNDTYGQRTAKGEVTFIRLLPGPLERVWSYFVESDKRAKWLASGPLEPRVGGRIDFHFRQGDLSEEKNPPPVYAHLEEGTHVPGIVTRCKPPGLFSFTWGTEKASSEVIVRLAAVDRQVRLVLTHRRLAGVSDERNVAGGWHVHLDFLLALLEGAPPPLYWTELQRVKAEYAELYS
ncbi:MAG TPA: SRPBCC family protein [Verrucomicrobiales bacterium]|jgi:uncharacterized protein YndB with AHSA1/START domain|nr:SRPBCC family protein [Verrucomicrobiales bacterium]